MAEIRPATHLTYKTQLKLGEVLLRLIGRPFCSPTIAFWGLGTRNCSDESYAMSRRTLAIDGTGLI